MVAKPISFDNPRAQLVMKNANTVTDLKVPVQHQVFYRTKTACTASGWSTGEGWYWIKGTKENPLSDPAGPFQSQQEAMANADLTLLSAA
jgi:hypothetical protein